MFQYYKSRNTPEHVVRRGLPRVAKKSYHPFSTYEHVVEQLAFLALTCAQAGSRWSTLLTKNVAFVSVIDHVGYCDKKY